MKRGIFLLIAMAALFVGCRKAVPYSFEFTHTGCASTKSSGDTKGLFDTEPDSELILQYTDRGLAVTRTNAYLNCVIKQDGYVCDVSMEGNVILYYVHHGDLSADCVCFVERMSSTVSGLKEGTKYVLDYRCDDGVSKQVDFTFEKGLMKRMTVQLPQAF